jgi:hypothetical protein
MIFLGVTPQAEGNAESPGSGGASPYLRRGSRVKPRYKLALMGVTPGVLGPGRSTPFVAPQKAAEDDDDEDRDVTLNRY